MPDLRSLLAAVLVASGLAGAAGTAAAQEAASVSISSARLALMQLAAATGEQAAPAMTGEGGSARAIYLQSGKVTLDELTAAVAGTEAPQALTETGGATVARLPIVVLQGAELTLDASETLALDREAGAYVLSLGRVTVDGATIESRGETGTPFRPFVAGVGQRSLALTGGTFTGLGFGAEAYSAGVSLSGRGLLSGGKAAPMTGNTFDGVEGVVLSGIDAPRIEDNVFRKTRGTALRVSDGRGGRIAGNRFQQPGGAYALRVSAMSGLEVAGNTFAGGTGKALRIEGGARETRVRENYATAFGGTAITVAEGAGCTRLSHNVVTNNDGGGIRAEGTGALILDGNVVSGNSGTGIEVARQQAGSDALLVRNTLENNRAGIRGVGLASIRLARNDLTGQMPRLLSGDLDQLTPDYLRAARDTGSADLRIEGVSASPVQALRRDAAASAFDACTEGGSA